MPLRHFCIFTVTARSGAKPITPTEWIDPDTGHRVVQLSHRTRQRKHLFQPESLSRPTAKRWSSPRQSGISTVDLETHAVDRNHCLGRVAHHHGRAQDREDLFLAKPKLRTVKSQTNRLVSFSWPGGSNHQGRDRNPPKVAARPAGSIRSTLMKRCSQAPFIYRDDWGTNEFSTAGQTGETTSQRLMLIAVKKGQMKWKTASPGIIRWTCSSTISRPVKPKR